MSLIQSLTLCLFIICFTISQSHALYCRVCDQYDSSCLFLEDTASHECENEDDLCYSWFYRTGDRIGVRRNCIAVSSLGYSLIRKITADGTRSCRKRIRGVDCFNLCSTDLCN